MISRASSFVHGALRAGFLALAAAVLFAAPVRAECGAAMLDWAKQCEETTGVVIVNEVCPDDVVVLSLDRQSGGALRVEVRASAEGSFRAAGGLGLSPVGHFDDWPSEPEDERLAFDSLAACVARAPEPLRASIRRARVPGRNLHHDRGARGHDAPDAPPVLPWRLALAALAAVLVAVVRVRASSAVRRARTRRTALSLGVLVVATWLARSFFWPAAFFHQNGQGPLWVSYALGRASSLSAYGTGYREVFSVPAAMFVGDPSRSVFATQAILGALVPAFAWTIARRVGARRGVAAGLAFLVACDPLLSRLARSESYFATILALLFAASALLCAGVRLERSSQAACVCAVLGAGFLVAQAARVHIFGWVAGATIPLPLLLVRGPLRKRVALLREGRGRDRCRRARHCRAADVGRPLRTARCQVRDPSRVRAGAGLAFTLRPRRDRGAAVALGGPRRSWGPSRGGLCAFDRSR